MNKIKTHSDYLKSVFRHKVLIHFLRIFLAVFFVSAWEICAEKGIIDSFIFSSPKRIVKCFIELTKNGFLIRHVWKTIYETLICFIFVMIAAIAAAVLMWLNKNIFKVAEPFLVLLNSLPKSALAPVLIVWLGNSTKTVIIAAESVAVFGAMLSIYTSFTETDKEKIKLIRTLGGKKRHVLFYLLFPSSLPTIVNAMKVNLGLSLVGVIIGEFLAAKEGLGYLIIYGSQVFKMDWVLLSIVLLSILSVILYIIIGIFEKRTSGR